MRKLLPLLFMMAALAFVSCEETSDENEVTSPTSVEVEIVRLVNEHRVSLGKPVLESNDILWKAARSHTEYMIGKKAISHDNFESRLDAIAKQLSYSSAGENVASGYTTPAAVMTGWLNSQGHRENIEGDYNKIGVGAIQDADGTWYYTQIFLKVN